MKYYITADVHGFYTEFHKALDEAGYFTDPEPHKPIISKSTVYNQPLLVCLITSRKIKWFRKEGLQWRKV